MTEQTALLKIPVFHKEVCGVIAVYPDRVEWPGSRVAIRSVSRVAVQDDIVLSIVIVIADGQRTDFRLAHRDAARLHDTLCELVVQQKPRPRGWTGRFGRHAWRCARHAL